MREHSIALSSIIFHCIQFNIWVQLKLLFRLSFRVPLTNHSHTELQNTIWVGLELGMYRVQFFTEYRVLRRFFSEYRVFNKLEKLEEK